MPSRPMRLLILLVTALLAVPSALLAVPSALLAGEDGATDAPGFVFVQIDGLSGPTLHRALEAGAMPFIGDRIDRGLDTLGSWWTTAASATTVTQAGVLHGRWRDVPGFRWWDRDTGQLIDFLDRERARAFEAGIAGPGDLLTDGGASITNLFSGGAPRIVLTATQLDGLAPAWEVVRHLADVPRMVHVIDGFVHGAVADVRRLVRGDAAPSSVHVKRKAPLPVVGPGLEWALVDVTAAAVVRELQRGTPLVYATFTTYDEVGHYAGPDHPAAIDALRYIDEALGFIATAAGEAPRPYHLVVLSDHGQTGGEPFEVRYGEALEEVVRGLAAEPPDLIVAASGNLAHLYVPGQAERLDAAEIEALHPGLVAGLVEHPGVGVVVVRSAGGHLLALGPGGSHDLTSGHIDGRDPIAHYGPLAEESLFNIAASPDAGDLVVVSVYDPVADEVTSFEPQLGSHGGIGGPQTQPFLLYPSELEPGDEPLSLLGIDALRARIDEWLAAAPAGAGAVGPEGRAPESPTGAHLGEQVCTSAQVTGAAATVCARRERFGARWTLQVTDTQADDRAVEATVRLEVAEARDQSATLENEQGVGTTASTTGSFSPRLGSAIGEISVETCVVFEFGPHRCSEGSAILPQLASRATPTQAARLEQLVFEEPLESFLAAWEQGERPGLDADFEWRTNGCSAGPFAELFADRLAAACVRHDFAYRNLGNLFYGPTDSMRRRIDERLAADAIALGQENLAPGLFEALQRFGAPAFYGSDMVTVWSVPTVLVPWIDTDEAPGPAPTVSP